MTARMQDDAQLLFSTLPQLRAELKMTPLESTESGAPTAALYDPVKNQFYQIGWVELELLSRWNDCKTVADLMRKTQAETTCHISLQDIRSVLDFLKKNELVAPSSYEAEPSAGLWGKMLKGYLFWKLPLVRPDRLLDRLLPYTDWIFQRKTVYASVVLAVVLLVELSKQWDSYVGTFPYLFSPVGMFLALFVYGCVKIAHEFGHALALKRQGGSVATMGVAFLFFIPVLYSDTTQAWALRTRKERMGVDAAGVGVELFIAVLATLGWLLTDEGALKSALFTISSTSWIISLVVNSNPLMKFDGYYLLSDWWRMPNLQSRALRYAQWVFRRRVLAIHQPPPERLTELQKRRLLIYGIASSVYKLVLYYVISIMIYAMVFKALGILLIMVNTLWFIILPAYREGLNWWQVRDEPSVRKRARRLLPVIAVVGLFGVVPIPGSFLMSAVLAPSTMITIYAPEESRVDAISAQLDAEVKEGAPLVELSSSRIHRDLEMAINKHHKALDYMRVLSFSSQMALNRPSIEQDVLLTQQVLLAAEMRNNSLSVRSPLSGSIVWVADDLAIGGWVGENQPLLMVAPSDKLRIKAYVPEDYWQSIDVDAQAKFFPAKVNWSPLDLTIETFNSTGINYLDDLFFSSLHGGEIPVRESEDGSLVPVSAHRKITFFVPDFAHKIERPVYGYVRVKTKATSPLLAGLKKLIIFIEKEVSF